MKGRESIDIRSVGAVHRACTECRRGRRPTSHRRCNRRWDVRAAPATRETDLLQPVNMVDTVFGILLSGGNYYGLDAAGGVMNFRKRRASASTPVPTSCRRVRRSV